MFRTKTLLAALLVFGICAAPAAAQQTLTLNAGWFALRGAADRVPGDTIVANLFATPPYELGYRISDFDNTTFGGDWLFPLGEFFEGGIGVNYYAKTVPSFYTELQDQTSGADIRQNLSLRAIPVTASIRFIPTGRRFPVQPYIGFGVSVVPWRYSEIGDFVDSSNNVYAANYHDSGVTVGPMVMAGIRLPIARVFALGGEVRYLKADTSLDPTVGFLGDRLDLGGISYLATFSIKF
jgi:outer membrane protein W